jgi:integrase
MSNKSSYNKGLGGKMQRFHTRFDNLDVLPVRDLPLFAAACRFEKETVDLPDSVPARQTAPSKGKAMAVKADGARAPASLVSAAIPMHAPITADRLIGLINGWDDITETRRQALVTAIRHADHIVAVKRETLMGLDPWSCASLNACLWANAPSVFGMSAGTHRNMVSGLRFVLRRLGRHADAGHKLNKLGPAWDALYKKLPTNERRRGLVSYFRFLTLANINPDMVPPDAIDRFNTWCRADILHEDPGGVSRRAAGNWEFARQTVPGWPQVEITRTGMRDNYALAWSAFPVGFVADVDRMLGGLAAGPFGKGNPFSRLAARAKQAREVGSSSAKSVQTNQPRSPRSIHRALSPRTIATRRDQIKISASALVLSGVPIGDLISLSVLVQPLQHAEMILSFHRERLRKKLESYGEEATEDDLRSSNLAGIGEVLRQIAKFDVHLPDGEMDELNDMLSLIRPEAQVAMTPKNHRRLKALLEDRTFATLLHTPRHWVTRDAAEMTHQRRPKDAALTAMYGAALEVLMFLPIRRENLLELRLDTHLRRPVSGGLITEITIPAKSVKNREPVRWPVEPESAQLLETYIRTYRPLLARCGNDFLFPGMGSSFRNPAEFGHELSQRVERQIGAEFNCHIARHFAVVRYLRANPGSYEVAAQILGHRNPDTTRRFYAGLEQDAAARHVNALLTSQRHETKILALGAYHRPKKRSFVGAKT